MPERLTHADVLELKRWNTPTIYNGWEQITQDDAAHDAFNLEEVRDFMPWMGPMVGYAVPVVVQPGNREPVRRGPHAWSDYRRYVASIAGPKIVVVQDMDKPATFGSFWGEVNANAHRALGCVGTITDGAIRDLDEMSNAGFKALARRLCVGHAWAWPIRWDCEVTVFGRAIAPGQLIHADKHGFLVIPEEDESELLALGEVDAVFHAGEPKAYVDGHPKVGRLFPDYRATEQAYFSKTGIFPIMHAVAIKKSLTKENPAIIEKVFRAYSKSKQMAYDYLAQYAWLKDLLPWIGQEFADTRKLMGENFYSYGIKPNRKSLETLFRYSHEQKLSKRRLTIEELFEPASLEVVE